MSLVANTVRIFPFTNVLNTLNRRRKLAARGPHPVINACNQAPEIIC